MVAGIGLKSKRPKVKYRQCTRTWKQHYSLYPAKDELVAAFKDELALYKVKNSTIRFPLSQPVPVKLLERIAIFRAKEVAQRAKAKNV